MLLTYMYVLLLYEKYQLKAADKGWLAINFLAKNVGSKFAAEFSIQNFKQFWAKTIC